MIHVHKQRFSFFLRFRARLASKLETGTNMTHTKFISQKITMGIKKIQIWRWFESGEKVAKMSLKKILTEKWTNLVAYHILELLEKVLSPQTISSDIVTTFSMDSASNSAIFAYLCLISTLNPCQSKPFFFLRIHNIWEKNIQ